MTKSNEQTSGQKPERRERRERRFAPRPATPPVVVRGFGAMGAALLGAGSWEAFGNNLRDTPLETLTCAPYMLAVGAASTLVAVFLGTSREPTVRVGDPGIAVESSSTEIKRIAWYNVDSIRLEDNAVVVVGKDETGEPLTIRASTKTLRPAAAWIVREARARIASKVSISDTSAVGDAADGAGEIVRAASLQVVGMRCAATGRMVAFQPDARVCHQCERVFHKDSMPAVCPCGATFDVNEQPFENDGE